MTICIGALCDNKKTAIIASDRMVTGSYPPIEFEHTKSKIFPITKNCVILTAGNALKPAEITNKVISSLFNVNNPLVENITEKIKSIYQGCRLKNAEENFLKTRGIPIEVFYQRSNMFPLEHFSRIDYAIHSFDYGLNILVVGYDSDVAHIHQIVNPGISECYDTIGFHTIGIGNLYATQVFIAHKYDIAYNLHEALNVVYAAKRAAEAAPGVGGETDMAIINNNGLTIIDNEIIEELKRLYDTVKQIPKDEMVSKSKQLIQKLIEKSKEQDVEIDNNIDENKKKSEKTNNKTDGKPITAKK